MPPDDRTTVIQEWIDRLGAGDDSAREALLACASARLTRIARKMLRGYRDVRRWEETDDVMQNLLLRLDRALRVVEVTTTRQFLRLGATLIRRELIDLARHYRGPRNIVAKNVGSLEQAGSASGAGGGLEPSDSSQDPERLAVWTEFHRRVESLADELREVFDLLWYQGLTQCEAAGVLGVSERTVKRRWQDARVTLYAALDGQVPE